MTTIAEVRRAADLIKILDQAEGWRDSFEADKNAKAHPLIAFEGIGSRNAEGEGRGWDGELVLPRALAIEMMQWIETKARDELRQMGIGK